MRNYYGVSHELKVIHNTWGKPYFLNNMYYFSLSYSYGLMACVIADYEIGLDLQKKSKMHRRIVQHYYTKEETEYLYRTYQEAENFSIIWSRKEAYGKLLGCGLTENTLAQNTIGLDNLRTYRFDNYYLSLCYSEADFKNLTFNPINFETFIEEINVKPL